MSYCGRDSDLVTSSSYKECYAGLEVSVVRMVMLYLPQCLFTKMPEGFKIFATFHAVRIDVGAERDWRNHNPSELSMEIIRYAFSKRGMCVSDIH